MSNESDLTKSSEASLKQTTLADDPDCCILCVKPIIQSGLMFGLLENCSHAFCYQCIDTWRKSNNTTKCPQCALASERLLRSPKWIHCQATKKQVLDGIELLNLYNCINESPCNWCLCSHLLIMYIAIAMYALYQLYDECK